MSWEVQETWVNAASSSLRHDVDLQKAGHGMHPVEDAKGQADVHNGGPHGFTVEYSLFVVIELWPGSKCWYDP